jgi:hypothetical protein
MSAHTPGPWKIERHIHHEIQIKDKDGWQICQMYDSAPPDIDNARLIAAAPELLETLERIIATHDASCAGPECGIAGIDKARATIAKARGESNG